MSKDNIYIYEMLSQYFTARKFQEIPTDTDQVTMFATYQKSSLYLINIIALHDNYAFDTKRYEYYKKATKKQFDHVRADHIILLNVIITTNPNATYEAVNEVPGLHDHLIDVHWIVDSKQKKLIIPEKQMKSVMGLEKPIEELVTTGMQTFYDVKKSDGHSYVVFALMGINILLWVIMTILGSSTSVSTLMQFGAVNVDYILATHEYWRLFTSMFLHIGIMHLLFNCFSLYIFGSRLEKYLSVLEFLSVYIVSGLFASLVSFIGSLVLGTNVVAAGASGAIYGLIGIILVLSKASGRPIEDLSDYSMWLIFIFGIVYSVVSPSVDALAHVGGFVAGLGLGWILVGRQKTQLGGPGNEE